MNHPEEVKALMLGESQKAELVTESSIHTPRQFEVATCDCGALWLEIMKMTHRAGCPHHPQSPKEKAIK